MKIEFTKEQYENLIKLAYVGNFVINGIRFGEEEIPGFNELEEHIYKHAKDFELGNLVAEEEGEFFASDELEENAEIEEFFEAFRDEIFWNELGDRLAVQAILENYNDEALAKMSDDEQFLLRTSVSDQFEEEFDENGLENVKVINFEPDLEIPEVPNY